jgi:hypothetical protein
MTVKLLRKEMSGIDFGVGNELGEDESVQSCKKKGKELAVKAGHDQGRTEAK